MVKVPMVNESDTPHQLRTCQECGHKQWDSPPPENGESQAYGRWTERACKQCKSAALDFGNTYGPGEGPIRCEDDEDE